MELLYLKKSNIINYQYFKFLVMENRVKKETLRTEITGKIGGANVNINYEAAVGQNPTNVNASAQFMSTTATTAEGVTLPAMPVASVNMNYNASGGKNINISGSKSLADVQDIVSEIETEIELIINPV